MFHILDIKKAECGVVVSLSMAFFVPFPFFWHILQEPYLLFCAHYNPFYRALKYRYLKGDPTVVDGHWSAPYFDEGAGNIHMVTFSAIFTTKRNLSHVSGGTGSDPETYFWGIATIDVPIGDLIHWEPFHLDSYVSSISYAGVALSLVFSFVCVFLMVRNHTTFPLFFLFSFCLIPFLMFLILSILS